MSSSASPAAIEPALRGEEQRHRARLLELEQRMIDAHAQWQIDHRNCRANDACDKRASQKYDDQRLEIARQRVKERAAHEKKLAELRAGTLSSPRDAVGDVCSSTAGDDRGTAGDPGGVQRGVPPGERPRDGAPQDAGAGGESSPTQRVLPQLGRLPSSRPDARQYAIAGPYPSGRVTLKVTWDEKITEHGQQIHRVGWCSFDVEYLPTGVAKVYEFGYSNADTAWPFQGQKQVEVTDIRPTFPPEGTEFGVPGQGLRIEVLGPAIGCGSPAEGDSGELARRAIRSDEGQPGPQTISGTRSGQGHPG